MANQYFELICERKIPLYERLGEEFKLKGKSKMFKGQIRLLSEKDLDHIMDLEVKSNIPEIRACEEKINYRFRKGNQMLGFELEDGRLIASVGWRYAIFSPDRYQDLPKTFREYSTPHNLPPSNFNAMFHYGINIDPSIRKEGIGKIAFRHIFEAMFNQGKVSGCKYCIFDPRLHTYNGSTHYPEIEYFEQDPKMKEAVDKAISGEKPFTLEDGLRDPAFRVYNAIFPVEFIKLMPNSWFPPDTPSGGFGFYCYKRL